MGSVCCQNDKNLEQSLIHSGSQYTLFKSKKFQYNDLQQNPWCLPSEHNLDKISQEVTNTDKSSSSFVQISELEANRTLGQTITKDEKVSLISHKYQLVITTSSQHPVLSDFTQIESTLDSDDVNSQWVIIHDQKYIQSGDIVLVIILDQIIRGNLTVSQQYGKNYVVCGNDLKQIMGNDYWRIEILSQESKLNDQEYFQLISLSTQKYLSQSSQGYYLNKRGTINSVFQIRGNMI